MGRLFGSAGGAIAERTMRVAAAVENAPVVAIESAAAKDRAGLRVETDPGTTSFVGAVVLDNFVEF